MAMVAPRPMVASQPIGGITASGPQTRIYDGITAGGSDVLEPLATILGEQDHRYTVAFAVRLEASCPRRGNSRSRQRAMIS